MTNLTLPKVATICALIWVFMIVMGLWNKARASDYVFDPVQIECLALNDYWEARSENYTGRLAVMQVVQNRAVSKYYPDNICDVVQEKRSGVCQFSWFCIHRGEEPRDMHAWVSSLALAIAFLENRTGMPDIVGGALHYHRYDVEPVWSRAWPFGIHYGDHVFYPEYR